MAGYSGNFCGESHADMNQTQFEKDCIDEFDKDQAIAEIKFNSERESLEKVAYTVFQDTARSMSGIYTAQIPDTSLSLLFNTAANKTTHLYKVFVELMKNGFELGTDYGRSRQKKDFLKWAKKRRCSISREELIGYICNKTNSANHHHRPSSGKHSGGRQELSSPRISRDESDFNIQPFKEANFQGRRSSVVAVGRGGLDDYHGCFIRERKRLNSACRTGSPSHKRAKICHMETEELE